MSEKRRRVENSNKLGEDAKRTHMAAATALPSFGFRSSYVRIEPRVVNTAIERMRTA
jgi:hypothetical protein